MKFRKMMGVTAAFLCAALALSGCGSTDETAYRIGINYTNNLNIMNIMEPELKKFAHEIGKTVFFGVRSDIEVVYICKFEPENPIIIASTPTEAYLKMYDPRKDCETLRAHPELFEKLRGDYPLRREKTAFSVITP